MECSNRGVSDFLRFGAPADDFLLRDKHLAASVAGAPCRLANLLICLMFFERSAPKRKKSETPNYDLSMTVDGIRPTYKHDESCQRSVPQALVCALEAVDFEDAIRNAVSIGGDSDTLAAIAGSVAEARFGIPEDIALEGWTRLPVEMRVVLNQLYQLHHQLD